MRMNGLSRRATIRKCEEEIRLSIAGVGVHCALLSLVLAACDDIRRTPAAWVSAILMALFALSQCVIILKNKKWLRARYGVVIWRIWTILNTQIAVVAWSSLLCYSIYYFDLSPTSIKITLICLGLAASGGTSLAFDLVNFYLYLSFMLLPLAATFFVKHDLFLGLGSLLYIFYCSVTGMQIHNLTVSLTRKSEQLGKNLFKLQHNLDVIKAMHESINESFVILNSDGVCSGETSDVAKTYFPSITEGAGLWDLLGLNGEEAAKLKSWYTLLFMDRFDFDDTASRGPKLLELAKGSATFFATLNITSKVSRPDLEKKYAIAWNHLLSRYTSMPVIIANPFAL